MELHYREVFDTVIEHQLVPSNCPFDHTLFPLNVATKQRYENVVPMPKDSEENANHQTKPEGLAEGAVEELVQEVVLHIHLQPLQPSPLDGKRP
jgi:hypothetical protein